MICQFCLNHFCRNNKPAVMQIHRLEDELTNKLQIFGSKTEIKKFLENPENRVANLKDSCDQNRLVLAC